MIFPKDFIVKAELNFERLGDKKLKCIPMIEDINGKIYYSSHPIFEYFYE